MLFLESDLEPFGLELCLADPPDAFRLDLRAAARLWRAREAWSPRDRSAISINSSVRSLETPSTWAVSTAVENRLVILIGMYLF